MTLEEIHSLLDTIEFGDRITITRNNGGDVTATLTGPALAAPPGKAVGIDLLDGGPHIIRRDDGQVFGHIVRIDVERQVGRL